VVFERVAREEERGVSLSSTDYVFRLVNIPLSRQNPKILWVDDAEIVGD
jgi:hypothetical protein